jgi:hypothetical protein
MNLLNDILLFVGMIAFLLIGASIILFLRALFTKNIEISDRTKFIAPDKSERIPQYTHWDSDDIGDYDTDDIVSSGRFSAAERKAEYRRRGKSPSGVIDGVYNDMYLEPGTSYNDANRDWEADA